MNLLGSFTKPKGLTPIELAIFVSLCRKCLPAVIFGVEGLSDTDLTDSLMFFMRDTPLLRTIPNRDLRLPIGISPFAIRFIASRGISNLLGAKESGRIAFGSLERDCSKLMSRRKTGIRNLTTLDSITGYIQFLVELTSQLCSA